VPDDLVVQINPTRVAMIGTDAKPCRCVSLQGEIGKEVACTIYANRSSPCREFDASWEGGVHNPSCDDARAAADGRRRTSARRADRALQRAIDLLGLSQPHPQLALRSRFLRSLGVLAPRDTGADPPVRGWVLPGGERVRGSPGAVGAGAAGAGSGARASVGPRAGRAGRIPGAGRGRGGTGMLFGAGPARGHPRGASRQPEPGRVRRGLQPGRVREAGENRCTSEVSCDR